MKNPFLCLVLAGLTLLSAESRADEISQECLEALTLSSLIAVQNDKVIFRSLVGLTELEIPKSDQHNVHLTSWTTSPDGFRIAALFTFTNKEGDPYVGGSVVSLYEAYTGKLLASVQSKRTGQGLNWNNLNPYVIAMNFVENPKHTGLLFDNPEVEDKITIGIELLDYQTLEKYKSVSLSRKWIDFDSVRYSVTNLVPKYSLLFDPKGRYMAKIYPEYFEVFALDKQYRMARVGTYKPQKIYNKATELLFSAFRTPLEHFRFFVSKTLAEKN